MTVTLSIRLNPHKQELAHILPTKPFLQPATRAITCLSACRWPHSPPPVPPFLLMPVHSMMYPKVHVTAVHATSCMHYTSPLNIHNVVSFINSQRVKATSCFENQSLVSFIASEPIKVDKNMYPNKKTSLGSSLDCMPTLAFGKKLGHLELTFI